MKKILIGSIILIVVVVGGFFLLSNSNEEITGNSIKENNDNIGVKTFVLMGENFKFVMNGISNPEIKVKLGDKVKLEFTSTKGLHDWVADEFNAKTKQVKDTDGMTSVEFVADKIGTFEYYCSIGEHRANGMEGKLIVE